MTNSTYNGWANHATWNVVLWFSNDQFLYNTALACVEFKNEDETAYQKFIRCMGNIDQEETGDGVRWDAPEIDLQEVEEAMLELAD